MKPKKPTTRAARFAAAEKALKGSNAKDRKKAKRILGAFGYIPDRDIGNQYIRWTPGQLHSMGLL